MGKTNYHYDILLLYATHTKYQQIGSCDFNPQTPALWRGFSSSFCAAAARTGEGLVELGEPLHVFPANYPVDQVLDTDGTCVLMKSGKKIKGVRELLGKEKKREVITVENCGMPNEKI